MRRRLKSLLCLALLLSLGHATAVRAAEVRAEDLFPQDTLAAVLVPDLAAAREASGKTRLGGMYAQPAMQEFLHPVVAQLKQSYEGVRARNAFLPAWQDLDAGLLSGEVAVAVYPRAVDQRLPVGVLLVVKPKDAAAFQRSLPAPILALLQDGQPHAVDPEPQAPALAWAQGRFLLCLPQGDLPGFLEKVKGAAVNPAPLSQEAAFTAARQKMTSSWAWAFVSPQRLIAHITSIPNVAQDPDTAKVKLVLSGLGLDRVKALTLGLGFRGGEPIMEGCIQMAGPPEAGLAGLFHSTRPAPAAGFKIAAPDAPFVCALNFNSAGLLPLIRQQLVAVGATPGAPPLAAMFDGGLGKAAQIVGFDIQKDLLANLGSEIVVAQTPLDTGPLLSLTPGLVMSLPVKNAPIVESCIQKAGAALEKYRQEQKEIPPLVFPKVRRTEHGGKNIYYVSQLMQGQLAFCVAGDRLLVGTSLNAIKRGLEQLAQPDNILGRKAFQETVARVSGWPFDPAKLPSSFAYAVDQSSGTGVLLLTLLGLGAATADVALLAELPQKDVQEAIQALTRGAAVMAAPAEGPGDIPSNEAAAMAGCMTFAEAQEIYRRTDWNKDGFLEYAQALNGKDSLYLDADGQPIALIDKGMADASGEPGPKTSRKGYRYKLLTAQGAAAQGGAKSYLKTDGGVMRLTLGYALVAYPSEYGVTGRRCFVINHTGTVYGKDLGPQTAELVTHMKEYNPDDTWKVAEAENAAAPAGPGGNEFMQFLGKPSGKVVLAVGNSLDLALWPDEAFFIPYRRPSGSSCVMDASGFYWSCELPPPSPGAGFGNLGTGAVVAVPAIVAAIAIPNLLRSRMAANETAAVGACKAFCEAQDIYRRTDWNRDGVLEYSQTISGKASLYRDNEGQEISIVDRAFAEAEGDPGGMNNEGRQVTPKLGYCFKVLKAQGAKAAGGKKSYIVNGHMTLGYALVAYPFAYDGSGRHTYLVNSTGTIFQKDMGRETPEIVRNMTEFNPDETWAPAE